MIKITSNGKPRPHLLIRHGDTLLSSIICHICEKSFLLSPHLQLRRNFSMKVVKIALLSSALAFAPAAFAQVADEPVETTEEQTTEDQSAEAAEEVEETEADPAAA
jgi:hypothetical protein